MNLHKTNWTLATFKMPPYIYELWRVLAFAGWKVWPAATDWLGKSGCTKEMESTADLCIWLDLLAQCFKEIASLTPRLGELFVSSGTTNFPPSALLILLYLFLYSSRLLLHLLLTPFSITSFSPFSSLFLTSCNKFSFLGRSQQSGIRLSHGWLLRENADLLSSHLLLPSFFSLSLLAVFSPQHSFYSHYPELPPAFQIVIIVLMIITAMGFVTVM